MSSSTRATSRKSVCVPGSNPCNDKESRFGSTQGVEPIIINRNTKEFACYNRILGFTRCVSSSLLKQLRDVSDKLDRNPLMFRKGHSSIHCVFTSYLLAMRGIYFMSLVAPLERYLRLSPQLRWRLLRIIPVQACSRKCVKKGR